MSEKSRRCTVTGTHFVETRPITEGKLIANVGVVPEGRRYIRRMSWGADPGVRDTVTADDVATAIRESSPTDTVFFPDTCFLRAPIDDAVWQALTTRQLMISPWVHRELDQWLKSPGSDVNQTARVNRLLITGHDRINIFKADESLLEHGPEYYCALLLLRKLHGEKFAGAFRSGHGRPPTKDEFFAGFKKLCPGHDDRAVRLAWKGVCDYQKPNFVTDEQLVTMAVIHGITTGRETTILTRDHDIMEQFYKLVFLIDTHYRSMLFAERFAADPSQYAPRNKRTICEGHPNFFNDRFAGEDDVFMRPNFSSNESWDSLLPLRSGLVNLGCYWFGDGPSELRFAEMVFCADTEMSNVLRIKSNTDGLNTNLLNGKNCHIWPAPDAWRFLGPCVAVATDRMIEYHPSLPPYRALDIFHALRSDEQFERIEIEPEAD